MDASDVQDDLVEVLFTEEQIQGRIKELAQQIEADYEGRELLIVGILRGAVMVMADMARSFSRHVEMDWMAVSSYGSGTKSSGVVRILKDLDSDISGRDVIIVDEIIDTGLTLSWLTSNLTSRGPASVEICTLLRKPEALISSPAPEGARNCRATRTATTARTIQSQGPLSKRFNRLLPLPSGPPLRGSA